MDAFLCSHFPKSFEYTDYEKSKTKGAASEFITRAIEDKVDLIGKRENYVGYITMRPHVEKAGTHGLFTDSTEVLSLRREDAARLGYDHGSAWRDLLRSQTKEMAEAMKIPLTDLRWYEQREQVIRTYTDAMPERIPLSQNKEFKSVRNAVIQEAMLLSDGQIPSDQPLDDPENPNAAPSKELDHSAGEGTTTVLAALRLIARITQIIRDDLRREEAGRRHIEKKLRQKIAEKMELHGQHMG